MKITLLLPGIFMKRAGYYRMGALGIAIFVTILFLSLMFNPVSAANNDSENTDKLNTRSDNGAWYIYDQKVIKDDRTLDRAIIINSTGELLINNSAVFEMRQNYEYHRNITIKNNGTLRLHKATLQSNKPLQIIIEDNGRVILENNSILKARKIIVNEESLLKLGQSTIFPGVGGLTITIKDKSTLDLTSSSINNADTVSAKDKSYFRIKDSEIDSKIFDITCKEITITSNKIFRDMNVNRVEYAYIMGSTVNNLNIESCAFMRISQGSKIIDSTFDDLNEVDIVGSTLENIQINEIDSTLTIKNSYNVSNVNVKNCTTLRIQNSRLNRFNLEHFSYFIEIQDSTIEQCSILPEKIHIYNSVFICSQEQLNIITRASTLVAYNSSFNDPLKFSGNSIANLVNCTTSGDIPPIVRAYNNAKVDLYWWLDVYVVDAQGAPLPDAEVSIHDYFSNEKITQGIADENGKVKFKLLANSITKNGWDTIENNSYFLKGKYDKDTEDRSDDPIWMEINQESTLKFKNVNKKKEEPRPLLSNEQLITLIFVIVVIIILIGVTISGRSKRNERNDRSGSRPEKSGPDHPQKRHPPGHGPRPPTRPPGFSGSGGRSRL
jgi:hypothetical protein